MRKFVLFFVAAMLLSAVNTMAQDIITLKTGYDIEALIEKVGEAEIEYKKWDNPTGPVYVVKKSDVFMIKYRNGSKDVFHTTTQPVGQRVEQSSQPSQFQQPQRTGSSSYQQKSDSKFSLHIGGTLPVGYFGDDSDADKASGAGPGFNVGLKGKIPLSVAGLGITISGDFFFNGYRGSWKDDWDEIQSAVEAAGGTFTRPRYINIPVFVGLNYKYSANQNFGVWGDFGLGPNLRTMTTSKTEYKGEWGKVKFPIKTSFGFQIGTGIMVKNVFSVGMHYYGLGTAKIKVKTEYSSGHSETDEDHTRYPHNLFMLRLGYHF